MGVLQPMGAVEIVERGKSGGGECIAGYANARAQEPYERVSVAQLKRPGAARERGADRGEHRDLGPLAESSGDGRELQHVNGDWSERDERGWAVRVGAADLLLCGHVAGWSIWIY